MITVNFGTQQQRKTWRSCISDSQKRWPVKRPAKKARRANIGLLCRLNHYASNSASQERCKGFATGLGADAKMVMLELDGDAAAMQTKISQYLTAHPDTAGVFVACSTSAHPALEAIKSLKVHPYLALTCPRGPISEGIRRKLPTR